MLFSLGFWFWLKKSFDKEKIAFWNKISTIYFITAGNLITCFILVQSISYNSLNNFFILSSAGLFFLFISGCDNTSSRNYLLVFLGFLAGFNFFIKSTTSIAWIFTVFIYLCLFREGKSPFKKLFYLISGVLSGLLLFFIFFQSPFEWLKEINYIITEIMPRHSPYKDIGLVFHYLSYISILLLILFKHFFILILLFMLFLLSCRLNLPAKLKWLRSFSFFIFISLLLIKLIILSCFLFNCTDNSGCLFNFNGEPGKNSLFITLIILFNLMVLLFNHRGFIQAEKLFVTLVLLVFPFVLSIGTSNDITWFISNHIAPWFALIILLSVLLFNENGSRPLKRKFRRNFQQKGRYSRSIIKMQDFGCSNLL